MKTTDRVVITLTPETRAAFAVLAEAMQETETATATLNTPVPAFEDTALLGTLTDEQLAHLSLGLQHNFFTGITRPEELGGMLLLMPEDGSRLGLSPDCTVQDAWNIAEKAAEGGGPPVMPGLVNVLAESRSIVGHWTSAAAEMPDDDLTVLVWDTLIGDAAIAYHDSAVREKRGDSGWIIAGSKRVLLGVTHWCMDIRPPGAPEGSN